MLASAFPCTVAHTKPSPCRARACRSATTSGSKSSACNSTCSTFPATLQDTLPIMGESSSLVAIRSSHAAVVACSKAHGSRCRPRHRSSLRRQPIRSSTAATSTRSRTFGSRSRPIRKRNADRVAKRSDAIARQPTPHATIDDRANAQPIPSCAQRIPRSLLRRPVRRAKRCAIRRRSSPSLQDWKNCFWFAETPGAGGGRTRPQGVYDPAVVTLRSVAHRLRRISCVCSAGTPHNRQIVAKCFE